MKFEEYKERELPAARIGSEELYVVCLCAAWCGVCRQYEVKFNAVQAQFPHIQFAWLDVEDQECVLGDIDVETFPTLLVGSKSGPMFLGPLLPQIKVLERLLLALQAAPQAASTLPLEAKPLWGRVVAQWHSLKR